MTSRYTLFCPAALVDCSEFQTVFGLAVACITECQGHRESTRAALGFLSQLIGWKSLRLQTNANTVMDRSTNKLTALVLQHGEHLTNVCLTGLVGGGPQMLWPALSDCLYGIFVFTNTTNTQTQATANAWFRAAVISSQAKQQQVVNVDEILLLLTRYAQQGPKGKAKMLLSDLAKVYNGEMTADVLLGYSIQQ
eukprot:CAMPEP_0118691348 /NCGR_PEP_ID=MMETSP0800-20121206/10630_1 /TAXON_ID=210618 ORGANISM="Striatella unipunctata, Strain CCMP2910" /NCGR_SAMPLE_ID=MMETSP0800 /ASSEMBLY_ACC=CAM_ASM_000638 /LENGTH=193 /DNA_ID=CAMNT_0006589117 /DNA_START=443 /DNA_END=1024 /DNA_ORIENTATION=-